MIETKAELTAMEMIAGALQSLSDAERKRVLRWVNDAYWPEDKPKVKQENP